MVGSLIRERRLAAGLSQERLAEVLGTTQRQITRWEGYSTQLPRDAARQQLGAVLGIAPHEWHLAIAEVEALRPAPRPRPPVPLPHFLADSLESLLARLGAEPYEDTDIVLDQVVSAGKGKGVTEEGARYRPRKEPLYVVRVEGECMVPDVESGDEVKFDPELVPEDGDWVVATIDGDRAVVKEYRVRGAVQRLLPLNGEPMIIDENVRVVGVVLKVEKPAPRLRRRSRRR